MPHRSHPLTGKFRFLQVRIIITLAGRAERAKVLLLVRCLGGKGRDGPLQDQRMNYNFNNLKIMSSLLQRRNKKFEDLKTSISAISVTRKVQQNHQARMALEDVRECQTTKQIPNSPFDFLPQPTPIIRMESFPDSTDSELIKTPKLKGFQYNYTENAFEQSFEVKEKLGEGAHGVVKRCIHKQTGKEFAVKILKMEDEHYRSIKTNFINIRQLKHNNIVKYKALYLNPKQRLCHLVMEYTPYSPLKPGMEENALREVFYRLLDALTYIHEKSICHRDIKPPNILCDLEKQELKLIDFGVSKNMKLRGRYEEMLTNTGTCAYKAPEMFLGGSYSEKIDSWAVGISLYELIAGYTPFEEEYHSDTINNITGKEVTFDSTNFNNFSSLVKDLILRLLKKNPVERLTCEQAKKHLWFNPHFNDIDLMQSAGFGMKPAYRSQQDLTWLLQRRNSVNQIQGVNSKPNRGEKETMKRWLSIISEDNPGNSIDEEYKFDFVESQSEDESSPYQSVESTSLKEIKLEEKDSVTTI